MPTCYTAPVQEGEVTELKDFAAACARAFGAFIHQRDEGNVALRMPKNNGSKWYKESLQKARDRQAVWNTMTEEEKYAEWSEYYNEAVVRKHEAAARKAVERGRYEAMLAQVQAVDVDSRLQNFKNFMVEQLESSIDFDCKDLGDYYTPTEYVEWCEAQERSIKRDLEYYPERIAEDEKRYQEQVEYIQLMCDTFGFEVEEAE